MIRLNFLVEGRTEQDFVNRLLAGHLEPRGVYAFTTRLDGITSYARMRRDVRRCKLNHSPDARFTTMIDYYARPRDFPGSSDPLPPDLMKDAIKRVEFLEKKFAEDIDDWRFIPYLQLHEFEALLFTDISVLTKQYSEHADAIRELGSVRARFPTPEHIDDHPATAPSKRILSKLPGYDKVSAGPAAATEIGLVKMRAECAHFNAWIQQLEHLGQRAG